jgi:alanine dehydrogenase
VIVGCPREIKPNENRVGLIPGTVKSLVSNRVKVLVERGAGLGSAITDEAYVQAGATLIDDVQKIWQESDIIVKVKEPLTQEYPLFREQQTIFTFLHLAAEPSLSDALLNKKVMAIAYETIEVNNTLPLLKPMSEVAGRMAVQVGSASFRKSVWWERDFARWCARCSQCSRRYFGSRSGGKKCGKGGAGDGGQGDNAGYRFGSA